MSVPAEADTIIRASGLPEAEQKKLLTAAKKDPELALARLAVMQTQPTYDELMARDPQNVSREERRHMVDHSRRERALWHIREARAAAKRALREGADPENDPDESGSDLE